MKIKRMTSLGLLAILSGLAYCAVPALAKSVEEGDSAQAIASSRAGGLSGGMHPIAKDAELAALQAKPRLKVSKELGENGHQYVVARVFINAEPRVVWDVVHQERFHDSDIAYTKVLKDTPEEVLFEQKYVLLPIIGESVCLISSHEVPLKSIDYKLVKSNRFKNLEGHWQLTPSASGKETVLSLTSYVNINPLIPQGLQDEVTSGRLQKRLANIKKIAESASGRSNTI
jgi:hypothetical protein